MIRALPGQREDWRLIHASCIKCKTQCNPNYCTAMTHLLSLFPIYRLCSVFHKTRSKMRMPVLSLNSWSREGQRHGDAYLFCSWIKCSAPRLLWKEKNSSTTSTSSSECFLKGKCKLSACVKKGSQVLQCCGSWLNKNTDHTQIPERDEILSTSLFHISFCLV